MKKLLSLILVVAIMFTLCSCRNTDDPQNNPAGDSGDKTEYKIALAFCANDYMNPFTCVTKVNRILSDLIFEPLIDLDEHYNPVFILAESAEYSDGVISVKIRDGVVFSDGSPLTVADVEYSFNLAKDEKYILSTDIASIKTCEIIDSRNIKFTVSKLDPYSVNLLSFPIIKSGSDKLESSDNVLYDPIGTGRYIRNDLTLVENENYRAKDTAIKLINLVNTPDSEALNHCISAGMISVYYSDLADGEMPKMMGKSKIVSIPNLVYIGVNDAFKGKINRDIRQIISAAIDRKILCEQAYVNFAVPASGLYPNGWGESEGLQTILPDADTDNLLAKLFELGYNTKDNDGYYANEKGDIVSLSLLVNEESKTKSALARLFVNQMKNVGIKITIDYKDYNGYKAALDSGSFQLFIGEVRFKNNMDVSPLLLSSGSASFGINSDVTEEGTDEEIIEATTQDKIRDFYKGKALFTDILIHFMSELPVIPVCYRYGWLGYDANLPGDALKPWPTNVYHGIWQVS